MTTRRDVMSGSDVRRIIDFICLSLSVGFWHLADGLHSLFIDVPRQLAAGMVCAVRGHSRLPGGPYCGVYLCSRCPAELDNPPTD